MAQACVHKPDFAPVIDIERYSSTDDKSKRQTLPSILDAIIADSRLKDIVKYSDYNKRAEAMKASAIVVDNVSSWDIKGTVDKILQIVLNHVDTPEGISKAFSDLFLLTVRITFAGCFPPEDVKTDELNADFILLHTFSEANCTLIPPTSNSCLASAFGIRQILPSLKDGLKNARVLLKSHLATTLIYYIAQGRPKPQDSKLNSYQPSSDCIGWKAVTERSWESEDLHVPKVTRALKIVGKELKEMDEALALQAAQLTVDWIVKRNGKWGMNGPGFRESWKGSSSL